LDIKRLTGVSDDENTPEVHSPKPFYFTIPPLCDPPHLTFKISDPIKAMMTHASLATDVWSSAAAHRAMPERETTEDPPSDPN